MARVEGGKKWSLSHLRLFAGWWNKDLEILVIVQEM